MPENPKYKSTGKINVDNLCASTTPADYVRLLYEHDYRLPQQATPVVQVTLPQIRRARSRATRSVCPISMRITATAMTLAVRSTRFCVPTSASTKRAVPAMA